MNKLTHDSSVLSTVPVDQPHGRPFVLRNVRQSPRPTFTKIALVTPKRAPVSQRVAMVKRKGNNRRAHRGGYSTRTPHSRTFVPRTLYAAEVDVKIPFSYVLALSGTSTVFTQAWKINSLVLFTGAVVIGSDQFYDIYKRVRVIEFDSKVVVVNSHASSVYRLITVLTNSATALTAGTAINESTQPGGKTRYIGLPTSGSSIGTIRNKTRISRFEGTEEVETSDSFASVLAASPVDPANLFYMHIAIMDTAAASVTFAGSITVTGHLWCRMFDAQPLTS